MGKIRVLIGIDEKYTRDKIIECFKYRSDYDVTVFDRNCHLGKDQYNYDLYWLEYEDLDFERLIMKRHSDEGDAAQSKVLFNSYCIRKGLIRKAQLAFYLQKYVSKKPSSRLTKYVPPTYVFQLDYLDYIDEALNDIYEVIIKQKFKTKNRDMLGKQTTIWS